VHAGMGEGEGGTVKPCVRPSSWLRRKLLPCLALPHTATTPTGPRIARSFAIASSPWVVPTHPAQCTGRQPHGTAWETVRAMRATHQFESTGVLIVRQQLQRVSHCSPCRAPRESTHCAADGECGETASRHWRPERRCERSVCTAGRRVSSHHKRPHLQLSPDRF
jgi:hypothetical protein